MRKGFKSLKNKNVLVIGLGKTGISVINKIRDHCKSLIAIDANTDVDPGVFLKRDGRLKIILDKTIEDHFELLDGIDLVIPSPGIPGDFRLIKEAIERAIDVYSEIELAWTLMRESEKEKTIAVTGTNGKTTVVTLITKIFNDFGYNAISCGNIGLPLIETIEAEGSDAQLFRIIEISSFQLERIKSFKPHACILLNITNDHIDRHITMQNYISLKFGSIKNQQLNDYCILNIDDPNIYDYLILNKKKINSQILTYSISGNSNILKDNDHLIYSFAKNNGKIGIKGLNLMGTHNILNSMGAILASKVFAVSDLSIEKSIASFKPLDHRLEFVGLVNGVRCFNDSKATNPDATIKALENFGKEVTLILGGLDKGMDFNELIPVLEDRVKNLILIGSCREKIYALVKKNDCNYRIEMCSSMEEAVMKGFALTGKGEVLLLSPACASMDMFKNYKERGNIFKKLVLSILKD